MRMHRGSSNAPGAAPPRAETLPLSASGRTATVLLVVARAGREERLSVTVPVGARIRDALERAGLAPEGCAVLLGDRSLPLDEPVEADASFTVLLAFSGG